MTLTRVPWDSWGCKFFGKLTEGKNSTEHKKAAKASAAHGICCPFPRAACGLDKMLGSNTSGCTFCLLVLRLSAKNIRKSCFKLKAETLEPDLASACFCLFFCGHQIDSSKHAWSSASTGTARWEYGPDYAHFHCHLQRPNPKKAEKTANIQDHQKNARASESIALLSTSCATSPVSCDGDVLVWIEGVGKR